MYIYISRKIERKMARDFCIKNPTFLVRLFLKAPAAVEGSRTNDRFPNLLTP